LCSCLRNETTYPFVFTFALSDRSMGGNYATGAFPGAKEAIWISVRRCIVASFAIFYWRFGLAKVKEVIRLLGYWLEAISI